ncbi:MAG: hypothetical protein WCV67_09380 [Victivallaceae bacterium]
MKNENHCAQWHSKVSECGRREVRIRESGFRMGTGKSEGKKNALCSTTLQSVGVGQERKQESEFRIGTGKSEGKTKRIVLNGTPKCRSRAVARFVMPAAWAKQMGLVQRRPSRTA